jgi:hypothetical protein
MLSDSKDRRRTLAFIRDVQRRTEESMKRIAEQREKLDKGVAIPGRGEVCSDPSVSYLLL